jgi:hypothetical protein
VLNDAIARCIAGARLHYLGVKKRRIQEVTIVCVCVCVCHSSAAIKVLRTTGFFLLLLLQKIKNVALEGHTQYHRHLQTHSRLTAGDVFSVTSCR